MTLDMQELRMDIEDLKKRVERLEESTGYNYRCPRCGGEFDEWDGSPTNDVEKFCPFCGKMKYEYLVSGA